MSRSANDHTILVAVDGSPESDAAVAWSARESAVRHLPVTLMHVVPPWASDAPSGPMLAEWGRDNAHHVLEQARKNFESSFTGTKAPRVETKVRYGAPASTLVDAAADAHMIVVGSRGLGGVKRLLLGSVSAGVLQHARCPVVVVHHVDPPADAAGRAPILLGIDGSPASEAATAFAFEEASLRGADLIALHAWSDVPVFGLLGADWHSYEAEGRELLAERLAGWGERYPDVHVERAVACDQPARRILEESRGAQLVVVGTHGRGNVTSMLLGSVSSAVAQSAESPVVVVRADAT
jgi:nucleotide-binding universal stress UspA family protein